MNSMLTSIKSVLADFVPTERASFKEIAGSAAAVCLLGLFTVALLAL